MSDARDTRSTDSHRLTIPAEHYNGESERVTTAWKKVYRACDKRPWELIPIANMPRQWSQGLAEKFAQVITIAVTIQDVTLRDVTNFIVESINLHTRKDMLNQFTASDCDQAKAWLDEKRQAQSTNNSRKRRVDAHEPTRVASIRRLTSDSHIRQDFPCDARTPSQLVQPASRGPIIDVDLHPRISPSPHRDSSIPSLSKAQRSTPLETYCSWLTDRMDHMTTDLRHAREKRNLYSDQLRSQTQLKETLSAKKQDAEKEAMDAQKNLDHIITQGATTANLVATLSPFANKEGSSCPADVIALLAKYQTEHEEHEGKKARAEDDLKAKQNLLEGIVGEFETLDVAVQKLMQQRQSCEDLVARKSLEEQFYRHMLRLIRLDPSTFVEMGQKQIDELGKWIDGAQACMNRGEDV
ncbi:hypothetical protein NW762_013376 [Fusarium torreyae]|uniref:Uncharacterized protein n=1 Tax=Fusarium torreyae TaxID=1237075 RepID=A0A9W8RM29_9HYPO|nr:hypothetical protein NW762_013376 [Fusarium torreyae]